MNLLDLTPTQRKALALALLLVVAGLTFVFWDSQRRECLGQGQATVSQWNEFDVTETDQNLHFTHTGRWAVGGEAHIPDSYEFHNITLVISDSASKKEFRAEWTSLENGSYPIRIGDTASLPTADTGFRPSEGDSLVIYWVGFAGEPGYCDWTPILPDRELTRERVYTQDLNGTNPGH